MRITVNKSYYNIGDKFDPEDLENEYKEFIMSSKYDSDTNFYEKNMKSLLRGEFPNEINSKIFDTIYSYMDKYFLKYFTSLSNLDNKNSSNNFSKFYIGISDNPSIITGIPIKKRDLNKLINGINLKIINFLKHIRTYHKNKGSDKYIFIKGNKYYFYDKLLTIILRLFKVNIHILNKKKIKKYCVKKKVNDIYARKRLYNKIIKNYKKEKNIVYNLNNKYSQSITVMLFNYEVINIIEKFIKKDNLNFPFKQIHNILKKYVNNKDTISNYIHNGVYVKNSIKDDNFTDKQLSQYINVFISKFREFRNIEIKKINRKKIKKPFNKRYNPLNCISTIILQINNFNNIIYDNDDIIQIMIEIEIPIIKDSDAVIGYYANNKLSFPKRKMVQINKKMFPITYC